MLIDTEKALDLGDFFSYIYDNEEGYVYVALKSQDAMIWQQHFYSWPDQKQALIQKVKDSRADFEVYYGPALFNSKDASKESVKGARVFWVEFDGNAPDQLEAGIPDPTLRIRSSEEGREHWYWKSDVLVSTDNLEQTNRALTYLLHADVSGWDANQVLRPIDTINHKRQKHVELISITPTSVSLGDFAELALPPPIQEIPVPESIPSVEDVISKYAFTNSIWNLFKTGVMEGARGRAQMTLGYHLAEMGMSTEEMFSVLLNADERWGKFAKRNDRFKRLNEIVVRAKAKFPGKVALEAESGNLEPLGLKSFLATEIHLKWVWEGMLQEGGYMLVTGPSGVGKTQFALNMACDFALKKNFLDFEVTGDHKIGFFSLEMGMAELKYFVEKLAEAYTEEEKNKLEENLLFFALGEPLYLSEAAVQEQVEKITVKYGLTGLIFDSLGSTTSESLSAETEAKKIMDWNDKFRNRTGAFTLYIHHHRKATGDNKKPNKLADVYGSHYFTSRTTTTLSIWDAGISNTLSISTLKLRLAPKKEPFNVFRDGRLRFTRKQSGITVIDSKESDAEIATEVKIPTKPTFAGGGITY